VQNIKDEISKNESYANLNSEVDRVITVIFTSSSSEDDDLDELRKLKNLIVIDRDCASSFYGPLFTDRAYFAGAQDKLRLNEWNVSAMKAWYGKLSDATIMEIIKARETRAFTKVEDLLPIVGEQFVKDYANKIVF